MASFLAQCQFKYGGLAKAPGEKPGELYYCLSHQVHCSSGFPDPYHTYLSLAILAILPSKKQEDPSWKLPQLNALWNATEETAQWAKEHIPGKGSL